MLSKFEGSRAEVDGLANVRVFVLRGDPKLFVVVPTPDAGRDITQRFIEMVRGCGKIAPTIVIVESSGRGFSFARSMNAGILEALESGADVLALSNDDVTLPPGWVDVFHSILQGSEQFAYVAPVILSQKGNPIDSIVSLPSWYSIKAVTAFPFFARGAIYPIIQSIRESLLRVLKRSGFSAPDIPMVLNRHRVIVNPQPFCILSRKSMEEIGLFDSQFSNGVENFDFAIRAYLTGRKVAISSQVTAKHNVSATLGKGWASLGGTKDSVAKARMLRNWELLSRKYTLSRYKEFEFYSAKSSVLL